LTNKHVQKYNPGVAKREDTSYGVVIEVLRINGLSAFTPIDKGVRLFRRREEND
jgi:hypothetical protein